MLPSFIELLLMMCKLSKMETCRHHNFPFALFKIIICSTMQDMNNAYIRIWYSFYNVLENDGIEYGELSL